MHDSVHRGRPKNVVLWSCYRLLVLLRPVVHLEYALLYLKY